MRNTTPIGVEIKADKEQIKRESRAIGQTIRVELEQALSTNVITERLRKAAELSIDTSQVQQQARSATATVRREIGKLQEDLVGITTASRAGEAELLRLAQAQARLAQAGGDTAKAVQILQLALSGVTKESLASIRAQTQLVQLQTNYANSPLIAAIRGQSEAFGQQALRASDAGKALQETGDAAQVAGASLTETSTIILQQAQALAGLQAAQGDNAGAAETLAAAFLELKDRQRQAAEEAVSTRSKFSQIVATFTTGLNFITAILAFNAAAKNGFNESGDAGALAGEAIGKGFGVARAAVLAVREAAEQTLAALRQVNQAGREAATINPQAAVAKGTPTGPPVNPDLADFGAQLRRELGLQEEAAQKAGDTLQRETAESVRSLSTLEIELQRAQAELLDLGAAARGGFAKVSAEAKQGAAAQNEFLAQLDRINQAVLASAREQEEAESLKRRATLETAKEAARNLQITGEAFKEFLRSEEGTFSTEKFLNRLADTAEAAQGPIGRLQNRFNALRLATTAFFDTLTGRAQQSAQPVSALETRLAGFQSEVKRIGSQVGQVLQDALKSALGEEKFGALAAQLDGIKARFLGLGEAIGPLKVLGVGLGAATLAAGALVAALVALGAALAVATPTLIAIGIAGLRSNSQLEQTRLGIASVIASVATLRDDKGVEIKGIDKLNAAIPLAQDQLDKLRIDALNTALTFEEIAPAFLQAIGPGLAAGLNLDQIRKTVIDLSQLIIPLTGNAAQLGQELRSIFSGDITNDSQVAKTLGITKELVEKAKEQGRLADLLNEKLAVAAATGKLMGKTFEAATSNLREAGTLLAATVTQGLFDALRDKINAVLPQIFSTAAGKVEIAPAFAGLAETLTEIFNRAGDALADFIDFAVQSLKDLSAFLKTNRDDVLDLIDAIGLAIDAAGNLAGTFVQLLGGQASSALRFLKEELQGVSQLIALVQDVAELTAAAALASIKGLTLAIETGLAKALSLVGIRIQSLTDDIARLNGEMFILGQRLAAGFQNNQDVTRQIQFGHLFDVDQPRRPAVSNLSDYLNKQLANLRVPRSPSSGSGGSGGNSIRDTANTVVNALDELSRNLTSEIARAAKERISEVEKTAEKIRDEIAKLFGRGGQKLAAGADPLAFLQANTGVASLDALIRSKLTPGIREAADEALKLAARLDAKRQAQATTEELKKLTLTLQGAQEKGNQALKDIVLNSGPFSKEVQEAAAKLERGLQFDTSNLGDARVQAFLDLARNKGKIVIALDTAQSDLAILSTLIRTQETQGLLTSNQARDQQILAEREARAGIVAKQEELLRGLEKQTPLDQMAINQAKEKLVQAQLLGTELTRQEEAQRRINTAQQEAIEELQDLDTEATVSMIKNRVRLADATVYHAERSNAAVLDYLARETKTIDNIVADSKISLIKSAFDAVDNAVGKLAEKFGILKNFIAEILSGLAKMILNKAFRVLFNLDGPPSATGNQAQQAGFGFAGLSGGGGGNSGGGILGQVLNFFTGNRSGSTGNGANFSGGTGGGLSAPPSISGLGNFGLTIPSLNGLSNASAGAAAGAGEFSSLAKIGGFKGSFLGGGGLNLAFPLIGALLGSQFGGKSTLGKILGGVGGAAVGLGVSFGASVFGALGGGLGALGPAALAALGPAALIGLPLIVGAILLGRAKQRKADEESSGDSLQRSVDAIAELRKQAEQGNLLDVKKARDIFENQILATFISEINQLKTKSVRESRLTNQVADLRKLFESTVVPAIEQAIKNAEIFKKQIPEFAIGGWTREGLAYLHDREVVLNRRQQEALMQRTGPAIFREIGVPGTVPEGLIPHFANGGTFRDPYIRNRSLQTLLREINFPNFGVPGGAIIPSSLAPVPNTPTVFVPEDGRGAAAPIVVNITGMALTVSAGDATEIVGLSLTTSDGRRQIVGTIEDANANGGA